MKIKFEFDSENEEDMSKYKMFNNATNMCVALDRIDNLTRTWYKYGEEPNISTEKVRTEIMDIVYKYVPDIDNL
jgi:hypothetical protein